MPVGPGDELVHLEENLRRIESLMAMYDGATGESGIHARDDLLRAQVVFIHATLEDYLRSISAIDLPEAPGAVLDGIPLVRAGGARKGLRHVPLGVLAAHRFRTVYEVIDESVDAYLSRLSFSSARDVRKHVRRCGLDDAECKPFYSELDVLIKRRHQIVHEADIPRDADDPAPLTREQVLAWIRLAREVAGAIGHAHTVKWGSKPWPV